MEFFADGDAIAAAKALFEAEQWNAFKTDADGNKKKRTMKDLGEFIETAMAQLGVDSGE